MTSTALVCVVNGAAYEAFADNLFSSAEEFFHPTSKVVFRLLYGRAGWPAATMFRYHKLIEQMPNASYVFLCDADMLFESAVGAEILPEHGITATLHPGYVNSKPNDFPYERRPESSACVYAGGHHYFAGGFVGGGRQEMLNLARRISRKVDRDAGNGIVPVWHDESCLNRCLLDREPEKILSPSFCYPDNDSFYKTIWTETYTRRLVALDKTSDQRGDR